MDMSNIHTLQYVDERPARGMNHQMFRPSLTASLLHSEERRRFLPILHGAEDDNDVIDLQ